MLHLELCNIAVEIIQVHKTTDSLRTAGYQGTSTTLAAKYTSGTEESWPDLCGSTLLAGGVAVAAKIWDLGEQASSITGYSRPLGILGWFVLYKHSFVTP